MVLHFFVVGLFVLVVVYQQYYLIRRWATLFFFFFLNFIALDYGYCFLFLLFVCEHKSLVLNAVAVVIRVSKLLVDANELPWKLGI